MTRSTPRPLPAAERRSGSDRRRVDLDRAGRPERRRGIEARKPEVSEIDMTASEWLALSDEPVVPARAATPNRLAK